MSVARRPLLTATAAGTLLCALWFVPSANATGDRGAAPAQGSAPSAQSLSADGSLDRPLGSEVSEVTDSTDSSVGPAGPAEPTASTEATPLADTGSGSGSGSGSGGPRLADTGGVDTTPYVLGGSVSLAIGVAFVAYSVHRSAREF
ncbi:cell wall protein [Streptomyces sp. NPDC127033]|uniref:cell wall protein n=1 Tax=Streptomyces sp. NPDC127033 TaxID=3347110 RepID=UPI00364F15FD